MHRAGPGRDTWSDVPGWHRTTRRGLVMAKSMWDAFDPAAAAGLRRGGRVHRRRHAARLDGRRVDAAGLAAKLPIWVQSGPQAVHAEARGRGRVSAALPDRSPARLHRSPRPRVVRQHVSLGARVLRLPRLGVRLPSTVFANPPADGYWVADFTGQPHFPAHPNAAGLPVEDGRRGRPVGGAVVAVEEPAMALGGAAALHHETTMAIARARAAEHEWGITGAGSARPAPRRQDAQA